MSKNYFRKIGFVNFLTPNKPRLIRFYRDILGMMPEKNQNEQSGWYGFKTDGATFAIEPSSNHDIYKLEGDGVRRNAFLQFLLDTEGELDEANAYLENKGVKLITRSKKADYGTFSNFRDEDGNIVELLVPPLK